MSSLDYNDVMMNKDGEIGAIGGEKERERERERVCVCVRVHARVFVCMCTCLALPVRLLFFFLCALLSPTPRSPAPTVCKQAII